MKGSFLSILLLNISMCCDAQLQIQLEGMGPGIFLSVNLEGPISKKNNINFRAGLGGAPLSKYDCNTGTILTFPIGLNYLAGKGPHYFEIGLGGTPFLITGTKLLCLDDDEDFFVDGPSAFAYVLGGYRYQSKNKRISYRLFVSPLFNDKVKMWGGAGLGWRFKS